MRNLKQLKSFVVLVVASALTACASTVATRPTSTPSAGFSIHDDYVRVVSNGEDSSATTAWTPPRACCVMTV